MKNLIPLLCLFMVSLFGGSLSAQERPMFMLGAELLSVNARLDLSWEDNAPNVDALSRGWSTVFSPYAEIRTPRGPVIRYSYVPTVENRFSLRSEEELVLWGTEFEANKVIGLVTTTSLHRWEILWNMPASPYVLIESWRSEFTATAEDNSASSTMNRFILGLGLETRQPISPYAITTFRGAYTFLNGTRGFLLDASLMTSNGISRIPRARFEAYSEIGYRYRENRTSEDGISKAWKIHGPYLNLGVIF